MPTIEISDKAIETVGALASHIAATLDKISDKVGAPQTYTLTGAADWPLLMAVGGLLLAAICAMWADLRGAMRDSRTDWKTELAQYKKENEKDINALWDEHRRCKQERKCPPPLIVERTHDN